MTSAANTPPRASVTVRDAEPADVARVHAMIRELARYEKAEHEVIAREADLMRVLFPAVVDPDASDVAHVCCDVAEVGGEVVGFAIWFLNYSTWLGQQGIYLEDLYVKPAHRRSGAGRALVRALAARCVARGYGRLDWAVLDWNEPALHFYEALGAKGLADWRPHRLTGDDLRRLAENSR